MQISGLSCGRPFDLKITTHGSAIQSNLAPRPYTVSVGIATPWHVRCEAPQQRLPQLLRFPVRFHLINFCFHITSLFLILLILCSERRCCSRPLCRGQRVVHLVPAYRHPPHCFYKASTRCDESVTGPAGIYRCGYARCAHQSPLAAPSAAIALCCFFCSASSRREARGSSSPGGSFFFILAAFVLALLLYP